MHNFHLKWCHEIPNSDNFEGSYQTAEEAAYAAFEAFDAEGFPEEITEVVVAQCVSRPIESSINTMSIVESISDNVFDEYGEISEEWCNALNDIRKDSLEELKGIISAWVISNVGHHNLFTITNDRVIRRDELKEHM